MASTKKNIEQDSDAASTKKKVAAKKAAVKKNTRKRVSSKKKGVEKHKSDNSLDNVVLALDSALVINNADAFYDLLEKYIDKQQDISIDASAVEIIDTAILQLLLAFVLKLQSLNIKVRWTNPSKEIRGRAATLGLLEVLGLG